MLKKRICVIGAGASGLVTLKELREAGHDVTCYEKHDRIAGVFYYSATKGGAYDSTRLTVSNYFMAYSSFPPKAGEKRDYWTWKEYADYLDAFADHFKLHDGIALEHTVNTVRELEDKCMEVDIADSKGNVISERFDNVVVCTGTNQTPKAADIPGLSSFTGELVHSANYKNSAPFKNKKVVCLGIGETGADVVDELSQVAAETTLSIRHYQALTQRYPFGRKHTNDVFTSNALYAMPSRVQNFVARIQLKFMQKFSKDPAVKEYARWNLEAGDYYNHFFTKTETFLNNVVNGNISLNVAGIKQIDGNTIEFNDSSKVQADVLMLNTGYCDKFDFLPNWQAKDMRSLYLHMFDPALRERITFIGWARPGAGGVPACSEMQARYLARICGGQMQLPEGGELHELIETQMNFENAMYHRSPGIRTLVHYSSFMNSCAKILGCSPWQAATWRNPKLLYKVWFGSQLPYLYRLYGRGSDPDMAKAVIYRLENGTNIVEEFLLLVVSLVSGLLSKLKLLKADPDYI